MAVNCASFSGEPGAVQFVLCVGSWKDIVPLRLRIGSPGPGYIRLPEWADEEYLAQLTAEKAIRKYVKERGELREWVELRKRNEALDLEVYALGALYICGPTFILELPERAARIAQRMVTKAEPLEQDAQVIPEFIWYRHRGGWINSWRY